MRLFEYLQQIHQFIAMGLIEANDMAGLEWILDLIFAPKYIDQTILHNYLETEFKEIIALKKELDKLEKQ